MKSWCYWTLIYTYEYNARLVPGMSVFYDRLSDRCRAFHTGSQSNWPL